MRNLFAELYALPVLEFLHCDAVAEEIRPFLLLCDAFIDGFGV